MPGHVAVRLRDVADRAGVSKSIASRVLNNSPDVSVHPETRRRILEAATFLGYRPNSHAKALASSETKTFACIVPDLPNHVYARLVHGAARRSYELGYSLLVAEDYGTAELESILTDLLGSSRVDGLIVASATPGHPLVEALRDSRVPHVYANRVIAGSNRNVGWDEAAVSGAVVDFFARKGHRCIAHVSGPTWLEANRLRSLGFAERSAELGITSVAIAAEGFAEDSGYEAAGRLIECAPPELTGVYVSSITRAVGALRLLADRGVRVPADLAVVANDDLPLAGYLSPSLTTVKLPTELLGEVAVDQLMAQIEGREATDRILVPGIAVVEREST